MQVYSFRHDKQHMLILFEKEIVSNLIPLSFFNYLREIYKGTGF